MRRSKILVRVNSLEEVNEYKKVGITNFLFPLEGYSIGYQSFTIEMIEKLDVNVFLLINRVFDNKDVDSFKKISDRLGFTKGILFEDIAVYQLLKDKYDNLVWNQGHAAVSLLSIEEWLKRVNSAVISNELTKEEIECILDNTSKKLILNVFGLNMAMYSRRMLLSNFNNYYKLDNIKEGIATANDQAKFIVKENEYGTVFFYHKYYNLINEIDSFNDDKVLYYYVDPNNISSDDMIKVLNGKEVLYDNRFFENKTIYKLDSK